MKFQPRSQFYTSLQIIHKSVDDSTNTNPSCLINWVQFNWNQVYKLVFASHHHQPQHPDQLEEEENLLPFDILADIFTRLPAKLVLSCARTSRRIQPLITSPSFVDIHLKRATPIIAFQYYCPSNTSYMVSINFTCENTMKTTLTTTNKRIKIDLRFPPLHWSSMPFLYGSHNGFLLFKNIYFDNFLFIWNPITNEKMILDTESRCHSPCAFYFHPKSGEHRVLLRYLNKDARLFEILVVSLETNISKLITKASVSHPPHLDKNPIILNGALHWPADGVLYERVNEIQLPCSNSIVVFNMDKEEVKTISHPGYQCAAAATHKKIQIIAMEGKLCYCDYNRRDCTELSLWILEDYVKQIWVKRHVVNIEPMKSSSILARFEHSRQLYENDVEVVHMYGDELLINLFRRNLFLCNLQLDTFRRLGKKSKSSLVRPVAHINSLVSLKKMDGRHV